MTGEAGRRSPVRAAPKADAAGVPPKQPEGGPYDFEWSYTEEPHRSRRIAILAKYGPQVRALYGIDPMIKWKVAAAIATQVAMAYLVKDMAWLPLLALAYCIGGVINHSMTLAMHEVSHNLAFKAIKLNRFFGMVVNLPLGIPSFASFKNYHMDHHQYQGEDIIDVDVPTNAEVKVFTTATRKAFWVFIQAAFYALRPFALVTKPPTAWDAANWAVQAVFDAAIYFAFGHKGLLYLIFSTLLGMGMHPMAGHFIAEHYTFIRGQETYSYYGPLNWFSFNVGYHNEHHDFPFIAGSRLPALRRIAPEFYDDMPHHSSWVRVIHDYIFNPAMGPHSRVKRNTLEPAKRQSIITSHIAELD